MAEGRQQFTFYRSFWEAAKRIKNKSARADLYDALCRYALDFDEPDLDRLPDAVAVAFISAKPNLDASRKKAESGKQGGSKPKANSKHSASKKENEKEKEKEIEIEREYDKQHPLSNELFSSFWDKYPAIGRGNREETQADWEALEMDESEMRRVLSMLDAWKASRRWTEDGGAYIPLASNFLDPKRQYIHAAPAGSVGAERQLDEDEKLAIRRMMEGTA